MPAPEGEITVTGDQHLVPGMSISVTDANGVHFVGRITRIETTGAIATVEEPPATWIRTGQTAYNRRNPADRVQIVGITEVINCRRWITSGMMAELGVRTTVDPEEFEREWWPHYNSGQTSIGSRFYHVRSRMVYEVFRETTSEFFVRDPASQHDVALDREGEDPAEWLYLGPRPTQPIDGRTDFHGISIQRKMSVAAMPPTPRSRFDRDDVL